MRRAMTIWLASILVVAALALTWALASGNSPRLGLDLQGGASVVLSPTGTFNGGALSQAQKIINNRVNGLGVAGATVQSQGSNIVVELPGVKNASTALATIGQTAQLQFRPVELDSSGQQLIYAGPGPAPSLSAATSSTTAPKTTAAPTSTTASALATTTTKPATPATTATTKAAA